MEEEEMAKQIAKRTFATLRPLCTKLLETVTTRPDECAQLLISLQVLVKKVPVVGLQACFDYVLFPVLVLLDAAVACRANRGALEGQKRLNVGDKVAESAVACLKTVLEKCPCQSVSQVTTLIRKLVGAAMLSPAEASEEFRHGIVTCLQAVFQGLQPCKALSCSCKYVLPSPFSILKQAPEDLYQGYGHIGVEEDEAGEEEIIEYAAPEICPLGYLQSLEMAPAIGHLLSLLLQIADREATLGGVGSGKLREDSVSTLRTILLKVGNADALAYFLPGVVSGLTKAIRSSMVTSKRSVTTATYKSVGAAGSTGALEESLRGLAELLVLVLADSRNRDCSSAMNTESSELGQSIDQVEVALQAVLLKAEGSSKAEMHGDSKLNGISIADAAPNHKEIVKAEAPTLGAPLRLERDRKWLETTVGRLEPILSECLPLLCAHPSSTVRLAVVESAAVLLFSCGGTLEGCTSLFLECLLALACDEWHHVASAASSSLLVLLSVDEFLRKSKGDNGGEDVHLSLCRHRSKLQKQALLNLLQRLLERLPQAIFTGNETLAVLHARRLAAALFFVGPVAVCSTFLVSMEACEKFVNIMLQCLSFSSAFAGPIDLSVLSTAPKPQALLVITDAKSGAEDHQPDTFKKQKHQKPEEVVAAEQLPRMPPWLSQTAQRVYGATANIIRLVGRAAASGRPGDPALMRVVETLLETLQQAADELSQQQQQEQTITNFDFGSGQQQRHSAVSACVLNELVYGASGQWTHELASHFRVRSSEASSGVDAWQNENASEVETRLVECMGNILHDYLVPELWDAPVDSGKFTERGSSMADMTLLHVLQDNAMLQQVLVEGIGVFGSALGKAFEDKGFLALVLYPLLEKLSSTNINVSFAADIALRAICYHSGYQSVKELVVQNADYVVDSLCRQLRHLELHPHAPTLLAAVLKHSGAAPHLLPLLEEPMQCIVLELEVTARSRHPQYTVPLLRALREIAKAARAEGSMMVADAMRTAAEVKATLAGSLDVETEEGQLVTEQLITDIQERERRRKSVASVGTSCLHACAPLLASQDTQTCLLVLDAIEDAIAGLADMDAAFPHLQAQRVAIEEFLKRYAMEDPESAEPFGSHQDEGNRSNILLPSMHQVWPQLAPCLRHTQPAVLVRVLAVIANLITICGGQFFTRRIAKDALPLLLKLLREGPSLIMSRPSDALRPKSSKELLLLRSQGSEIQETGISPAAKLKVQLAVLKCIEMIAGHQKNSSALETTYKPIVSWVVASACRVPALQAAAAETLVALSNLDADLVWLVVADLVHDGTSQGLPSPGDEFPSFAQVFPPLATPKDALWVQYSNHNGDCMVDRRVAENLLAKLVSSH